MIPECDIYKKTLHRIIMKNQNSIDKKEKKTVIQKQMEEARIGVVILMFH